MPSSRHGGRGRSAIPDWRVKAGRREVFAHPQKQACVQWIRAHQGAYRAEHVTLRLIPPNAKKG